MSRPLLDHIGIAVRSIAEGAKLYGVLGLELTGVEEVREQGVRVGFLAVGQTRIELLEPLDESSPIARHLERRGPGVHHLCLGVADIRAAMAQLADAGYDLLSSKPQAGAHGRQVCFVHPRSASGVLIELSQPPDDRE
jgi:methylmalonyl-CoA/ethylmalonyl-CoA epimerase